MGLFKGSIASIVSGKVGGLIFQRNMRIRPYRIPANPRTTLQDAVRGAFIQAAGIWATLTAELQDAWTTYGQLNPHTNRIGDSITLTGKQALIGLNVPRIQVGMVSLTDPPTSPLNVTPVGAGPAGDIPSADVVLNISSTSIPLGATLAVYVGKPRSLGSVRGRKALVYAGKIPGAAIPVVSGSVNLPTGTSVVGQVYDVMYVQRLATAFTYSTWYDTITVI